MANQTSSLIGADLSGLGSSTQLFALGTPAVGSGDSYWCYCEFTATAITGQLVIINQQGTAKVMLSSRFTANAGGIDIGAAQNLVNQGEFAWVAKRGRGLYVLTSCSFTAGNYEAGYGIGANSGRLIAGTNVGAGNTLLGFFITSSVGTADYAPGVPTLATLTWPRMASGGG